MVTEVEAKANQSLTELTNSDTLLTECPPEIENLPEYFLDKDFSNFKGYNEAAKKKLVSCKKFASNQTVRKSLVMFGDVGTGKTHLAVAILKTQAPIYHNSYKVRSILEEENGKQIVAFRSSKGLFLPADDFFADLYSAATQFHISKSAAIKKYLNYDFVLLDDLSPLNFTNAKAENLYSLINSFYLHKKRFIITTNFSLKQFDEFDPRITSRMAEMCEILKFENEDFRKREHE